MNDCNGTPITADDVAKTKQDLSSIIGEMVSRDLLPKKIKIDMIDNSGTLTISQSFIQSPHIVADPVLLSCFSHEQRQALVSHEVGHYQDPLVDLTIYQSGLEICLGAIILATTAYRLLRLETLAFRVFGWRSKSAGHNKTKLMRTIAAHTINGLALLAETNYSETRADFYSAHIMKTAEPMASAQERHVQLGLDFETQLKQAADGPVGKIIVRVIYGTSEIVQHGIVGGALEALLLLNNHPSDNTRIKMLRESEPVQNPPFGMGFFSYKQITKLIAG